MLVSGLTTIQKYYTSVDFQELVETLAQSSLPVSVCFFHKKYYERFATKIDQCIIIIIHSCSIYLNVM